MTLRSALKRLTSVRYLMDSKGETSFALGENGALLRRAVESRMRQEVTRGQLVTGVTVCGKHQRLVSESVQRALNERIEEGMKDDAIFNVNLESTETPAAVDKLCFEVTTNEEGKNDIQGELSRVGVKRSHLMKKLTKFNRQCFAVSESEAPTKMLSFFLEEQWKYVYHDFLRSRRKFWKRYIFNPWSIHVVRADATTDHPSANISWTFEDQPHYQLQVGARSHLGLCQTRTRGRGKNRR